ncbi:MAG: phosphodiester glycosidase family protein [Rikenellaceae bacterium]
MKSSKLLVSIAVMLFSCTHFNGLFASSTDSLTLVNAQWKIQEVAKGLTLKSYHFTDEKLFDSNQYITIIEVKLQELDDSLKPDIVAVNGLRFTSTTAAATAATAAINGSYFNIYPPYNSTNYVRVDGEQIAPNKPTKDNIRLSTQNGTIVIDGRNVSIVEPDKRIDSEVEIEGEDILTSGPLLRINGVDQIIIDESHFFGRHPRTAIAIREDGSLLLITIDGRNAEADGVTIPEMQRLVAWLGAKDALNLDGGGSSTMWIQDLGVVNHPSDNKKFDRNGERKVSNMIVIR